MGKCLAVVVLEVSDDRRKVILPRYESAILLQDLTCR